MYLTFPKNLTQNAQHIYNVSNNMYDILPIATIYEGAKKDEFWNSSFKKYPTCKKKKGTQKFLPGPGNL